MCRAEATKFIKIVDVTICEPHFKSRHIDLEISNLMDHEESTQNWCFRTNVNILLDNLRFIY